MTRPVHTLLSDIIDRHRLAWMQREGVSMATISVAVREAYERRYSDQRPQKNQIVEWASDRDTHQRMDMDGQRLGRMLPGGPTRLLMDLLPCWRDAFPPDIRKAFDLDLAHELGVMFAPLTGATVADAQHLGAVLMTEAGDAIREYLILVADGKITLAEEAQRQKALGELEQLEGAVAAAIATLKRAAPR